MPPQILFLDAYDSFTNNITAQLTTVLPAGCAVSVLPIDAPLSRAQFARELRRYDAVVCGPGPGAPEREADVGLMRFVFRGEEHGEEVEGEREGGEVVVPVLGVCLGFQVLVTECGGSVERLGRGLHGMVHEIEHVGMTTTTTTSKDIFTDVGPFKATLYHSLHANIGQSSSPSTLWPHTRWLPTSTCPDLVPLAWSSSERDPRILMAVRHATRPFWGVQYHPESVCTEAAGAGVLVNWFAAAERWNAENRPRWGGVIPRGVGGEKSVLAALRESHLGKLRRAGVDLGSGSRSRQTKGYASKTIPLPKHISPPDILEILGAHGDDQEQIILDSSSAHTKRQGDATHDQTGRFSIVALDVSRATKITHRARSAVVRIHHDDRVVEEVGLGEGEDVWRVLSSFWAQRRRDVSDEDDREVPFRGGFMGYVTYEMGLHGIGVDFGPRDESTADRADLCFVWVTKSVVLDHVDNRLVVQFLNDDDDDKNWIAGVVSKLESSDRWTQQPQLPPQSPQSPPSLHKNTLPPVEIETPDPATYQALVRECQEFIAAGDSYELCLTRQTTLTPGPSAPIPAWTLYKTLRTHQPAPFGSFIHLPLSPGAPTLVSSSPERFLSHSADGVCRMHPMKGTVRKVRAGGTVVTRAEAERVLQTPKEQAENLMIVDLVRHDLHGVCGAGRVQVPVLMRVEEYASVFQMVTVVEGQLLGGNEMSGSNSTAKDEDSEDEDKKDTYTGLDMLAAALPPGSMTGAPKKRSCEILLGLEARRERGLYSGVVGYMDVTGRGDWSVTIRSFFRWGGNSALGGGGGQWAIGAGGAVTGLSSPVGEWEEMLAKLGGPLGAFGDRIDGRGKA